MCHVGKRGMRKKSVHQFALHQEFNYEIFTFLIVLVVPKLRTRRKKERALKLKILKKTVVHWPYHPQAWLVSAYLATFSFKTIEFVYL